jgi:hypothetical protein
MGGGGGIGDGVLEALAVEMDLSLGDVFCVRIVVLFRRFRGLEIPFPQFLEDMFVLVPETGSGIKGGFSLEGRTRSGYIFSKMPVPSCP